MSTIKKLSNEDMDNIQGGWKLFGREDTPIEGTNCEDSVKGCCQKWNRKVYVFGIGFNLKSEYNGGCSNMINARRGNVDGCEGCSAC
jgi:hypothetical protein